MSGKLSSSVSLPSSFTAFHDSLIIVDDRALSKYPCRSSFVGKETLPPLQLIRQAADCRRCHERPNSSHALFNRTIPNHHDRWSNDFARCSKPKMPLRNKESDTIEKTLVPVVRGNLSQTPCEQILKEALRIMKDCSSVSPKAPCLLQDELKVSS
jgi:hypothetical protein